MSKIRKPNKDSVNSVESITSCKFIFSPGRCKPENLRILDESIKRIKKDYIDQCSFLLIDPNDSRLEKMLKSTPGELSALETTAICSIRDLKHKTLENTASQKNCICVWLDLERLIKPINFNDFFREGINSPPENEYYVINWEEKGSSEIAGFILNQEANGYLLSQSVFSESPDLKEFEWFLRQNSYLRKFKSIQQSFPFEAEKLKSKLNIKGFTVLKRFLDWNFLQVFRKSSVSGIRSLRKNTPLNRFIFAVVALLSFIIIPLISYNAGISGDEEKHYRQAEKVYDYFITDGKDTTALSDVKYKLNYYGQSFDLFTFVVIKKLNIEKVYEARHVMNGAIGALAIICSGLLARILMGNVAGIITMLLLAFSPGFLGHAMNNPLDTPFAFGYIFTLLQLVRFLKRLPKIDYLIALLISLGIAFTISIRIGGLLLIPYVFMFSGLYLLFVPLTWKVLSKPWLNLAGKGILLLTGVSVIAFFLSILPWPYALESPLKNPFTAMKMMENITVALRVMFEGKIIWSDNLPSHYIPKSILLSIPLMVMAGFVLALVFVRRNRNLFWIFLLFFVVIFPVAYIIYKESNVYGAWRHLLFIYPPMVVMAGIGMQSVLNIIKNKYVQIAVLVVYAAAMTGPATHIFRNYPNQYIYFNEIAGGVKKAYKKYETDYYMVSLKQGTDWIKENILKNADADSANPIRIVSNAPTDIINYYFREDKNKVKLPYTRYYDRGIYDWDYAVFFCNYIDPYQITHNIWPPKNTIYTVKVDGVKICAVVKRENKDDYLGFEMLNDAVRTRNSLKLDESIRLMESALAYDKYNEITYLNIAQAYILAEKFDIARRKLNILLEFYPNYEKAVNLIGYSYLNEGEIFKDKAKIDRAISLFNETLRINYKFAGAYHNLGLASLISGNDDEAFRYFQRSIDNNPAAKDSYYMMANIIEKRGDPKQAREIREYASRL